MRAREMEMINEIYEGIRRAENGMRDWRRKKRRRLEEARPSDENQFRALIFWYNLRKRLAQTDPKFQRY